MRRVFDLVTLAVMISIMIVVVTMTYILADYQNRTRLKEVKVIYEEKIKVVTSQAKKFTDNISVALIYMDTARADLKEARLNLERAEFWLENGDYRRLENSSSTAKSYFNRSHDTFMKALLYLNYSINSSTEEYKDILNLYVNYTKFALNLTHYGETACSHLENASFYFLDGLVSEANQELNMYNESIVQYTFYDQEMGETLIRIKDYFEIRE